MTCDPEGAKRPLGAISLRLGSARLEVTGWEVIE